ncbi:MAG: hypothetical protein NZ700_12275 [Gemmataceae bacterium]|nr:hypothetical protein [Gemmataceae bacterium]MDW8264870.1 hypothetical protein [Gemmataceae bacterium]
MRRIPWVVLVSAGLVGCASGPMLDNPALLRPNPCCVENPVYIPLGPPAYGTVFEKVIDTIDDYFEIAYANRYDGRIETFPRVAPGLEQPWKPGSPDLAERALATLQSYRHRASVLIQPADDGGFFVQVTVYKELEDLPRPTRQTAGAAAFRTDPTIDRQYEVIDPTVFESNWIPMGRDVKLEQKILHQLRRSL